MAKLFTILIVYEQLCVRNFTGMEKYITMSVKKVI